MRVLIIGGTGLISRGIIRHLQARGAEVTMFNRGQRDNPFDGQVKQVTGDRNRPEDLTAAMNGGRFDVVIDMVAFTPEQAQAAIDVFGGQCEQFIFCSTVCTYGIKVPPRVLVDETFPQEPISDYGRKKLACERLMLQAHEAKRFQATIIRPSSTYGPSVHPIDQLEGNSPAWDRIEHGLPVLCAGDGLGLWVSTHRDDCGKLFAYACLNPKTYGQSYNATRDHVFTWRDFYREGAAALGTRARLIFMPAEWIIRHDPKRFGLLREITQFHGAYSSDKAKRDVPEFRCEIGFEQGMRETLEDSRRRGAWRSSQGDALYEAMVTEALDLGVEVVEV